MIGVLTLLLFLSVLGHISVLGQASSKFKPVSQELILSLPQLNALSSTLGLKFGGLKLTGHKSLFVYNSNTGSTNIFYPVKKRR